MELFFNDLSIHEQFRHVSGFREAMQHLMKERSLTRKFGLELVSHRETVNRRINPTTTVFEAIQQFSLEEKRVVLGWLMRQGPFWDDNPEHNSDECFESGEELVTGSAIAEAALGTHIGLDCRTVSLSPSNWTFSVIPVLWEKGPSFEIRLRNYWEIPSLRSDLEGHVGFLVSWDELERVSRKRFEMLSFTRDCFSNVGKFPFALSAAKQILRRLDVLDRLASSVDDSGGRSVVGQRLYAEHFTGGNAMFSDSSDTEKSKFRKKLTFPHPEKRGQTALCGWHGKVNNPPFRMHFCWPFQRGGRFHVVYIGWKLTAR